MEKHKTDDQIRANVTTELRWVSRPAPCTATLTVNTGYAR
jgi:hypothetical protein